MILGVWMFFKGLFKTLMAISIPLLLVMVGLALLAIPTAMNIAGLRHDLRKSEATAKKLGKTAEGLTVSLKACTTNLNTLTTSLKNQNAAVQRWKDESDQASRRATEAARQARQQAKRYETRIDRIRASKPSGDVCASARELIVSTLAEDRP